MIRQGEIRDLIGLPPGRMRFLVVSADVVNAHRHPVVVPILRGRDDVPPYFIALGPSDGVVGMVHVNDLRAVHPEQLGESVSMIAGDTWMRVRAALRDLLGG